MDKEITIKNIKKRSNDSQQIKMRKSCSKRRRRGQNFTFLQKTVMIVKNN